MSKGKQDLATLLNFCIGTSSSTDQGRVVDVACLDFSKAYNVACHNKLDDSRECTLTNPANSTEMGEWLANWR